LEVNEDFEDKCNAADDCLSLYLVCCQKQLDVVACRRWQNRSLLEVNEDFATKQDAADDYLSQHTT
ncbi:MAG: hypothetical protein IIX58_01530, partial [Alistipes sp.]|nr:hypothetical protein [Alistipes sp.]